jgi:hypothetical protein
MTDYDMNTGIPHEPRTLIDQGFHSLGNAADITTSEVMRKSVGYAPSEDHNPPAPLANEVDHTNDSHEIPLGPSASDITMRTRNG